jgi:hypothetical protein
MLSCDRLVTRTLLCSLLLLLSPTSNVAPESIEKNRFILKSWIVPSRAFPTRFHSRRGTKLDLLLTCMIDSIVTQSWNGNDDDNSWCLFLRFASIHKQCRNFGIYPFETMFQCVSISEALEILASENVGKDYDEDYNQDDELLRDDVLYVDPLFIGLCSLLDGLGSSEEGQECLLQSCQLKKTSPRVLGSPQVEPLPGNPLMTHLSIQRHVPVDYLRPFLVSSHRM